MKQSSPEYLRVREEIIMQLPTLDHDRDYNRSMKEELADSILAIKGIAIISDDQSLPTIDCFKGQVKRILIQSNFKRVVE